MIAEVSSSFFDVMDTCNKFLEVLKVFFNREYSSNKSLYILNASHKMRLCESKLIALHYVLPDILVVNVTQVCRSIDVKITFVTLKILCIEPSVRFRLPNQYTLMC